MSGQLVYAREAHLDPREFVDVLRRSGLAARRPVDEPDRIAGMAANANLIVTARDRTGLMVGISRCVTDFTYCCYCSDLAVDRAWQRKGVGRRLIEVSRAQLHPKAGFDLHAAPDAMTYYPRIGMRHMTNAFRFRSG